LLAVLGKSKPRTITNDSLNSNVKHDNGRRDSLWYDDGHLNVTFRNDVLGVNDFAPYKGSDRQGCKRRCVEMLNASGEELSGELIKRNNSKNRKNELFYFNIFLPLVAFGLLMGSDIYFGFF
jgi:hypothetical protein